AEARFRVAAYLKAALDAGTTESADVRTTILVELATGTMDQFTAFIDTLAYLHLVLLTEDSECDRDEGVGTLQRITDPSMSPVFQRLVAGAKGFYAEVPPRSDS